jgi:glycosyltransferase involved in cell wall biosynthesis
LRILFVGIPNGVHAARWIGQVADQGWDLSLFPGYDTEPHPGFRNITIYSLMDHRRDRLDPSVKLRPLWRPFMGGQDKLYRFQQRCKWLPERATLLALLIRWLRPDIIHSLQIQSAAYVTLEAKRKLSRWFPSMRFPPWVVSNWGADISLFGHLPDHAERIRGVMSSCDYYHCECYRDVELGKTFGFRGTVLPVLPAAAGFDLAEMRRLRRPGPVSARRLILLKGYQHWAGRALVGLRAIERSADVLRDYRIAIWLPGYSVLTSDDVRSAAERLARSTDVRLRIEPPGGWSREDVLRLQGRARISIGLSITDAASTSMIEAMIMGSFPIQSNTGCHEEWVRDGETALLVHPEDPAAVEAAIRRAVADDNLVDTADRINARTTERWDERVVRPQVVALYERIAAERGVGFSTGTTGARSAANHHPEDREGEPGCAS